MSSLIEMFDVNYGLKVKVEFTNLKEAQKRGEYFKGFVGEMINIQKVANKEAKKSKK